MRYHIDTIPVWDAYKLEDECPFCAIENKLEKDLIDSALGGSVMSPEMRMKSNEIGFCPHHFTMLYNQKNRLGLALMSHTYLRQLNRDIKKKSDKIVKKINSKRDKEIKADILEMNKFLNSRYESCVICENIRENMNRYIYTLLHLYKNDDDFLKTYKNSKGLCIKHLSEVLKAAADVYNKKYLNHFFVDTMEIQNENMQRMDEELFWFTQKFDVKNKDADWKTSKDSVQRSIKKLASKSLE